jgi:DNA-binding transcriptional MerR regulator
VYGISVAAELSGMDAQRLRMYEARGLLEPDRTAGGTRRYSADDLDRLRRIGALLGDGLNLAGIAMVLNLQDENEQLHQRLDDHAATAIVTGDGDSDQDDVDHDGWNPHP